MMAERTRKKLPIAAIIATIPLMIESVGVYIFGIGLSVYFSFTNTVVFPDYKFIGFHQYERLWSTDIWLTAVKNIWLFGFLSIAANLVFGYLLAVFMDQRIKQEDLLRTIFLYPFAMSLIVTGLVWQWVLDPNYGLNATMHEFGWTSFYFSPLNDAKTALYGLVVAGVWQGAGVTMAILLAVAFRASHRQAPRPQKVAATEADEVRATIASTEGAIKEAAAALREGSHERMVQAVTTAIVAGIVLGRRL